MLKTVRAIINLQAISWLAKLVILSIAIIIPSILAAALISYIITVTTNWLVGSISIVASISLVIYIIKVMVKDHFG